MNILHSAQSILTPIRSEGYPFIALFFVISVFLGFWWQLLFWLGLALTLWCIYFFRDPPRLIPLRDNIVVSPADGKVSFAGLFMPPHGLGLPEEEMLRISVFMDVFSCHVNRLPLNASVKAITYRKGRFFNAEWDKASTENEANSLLLETAHGTVGLVQIAGLVARRIICWVNHGEELSVGQRFGLIRFGSRVDIYLPLTAELCVGVGQSMIAGETVLAQFSPEKNPVPKKRGAKGTKPAAGHNIEFRLD